MSIPLEQHQTEIAENLRRWNSKPLLREIYASFYQRISQLIKPAISGRIVEVGSGIGNLKAHFPQAICTDLFPQPWLDLVCDGYELPFAQGSVSHLVLFDVFHHLEAPKAFLLEARRVLAPAGRLILFEPCISLASFPVYGWLHHEPVAWRAPVSTASTRQRPHRYYAAQGNATRIFFGQQYPALLRGWSGFHAERFACFSYLLSGGYSKPAFFPMSALPALQVMDRILSVFPSLFAARCLVGLQPQ